jgi:hypothetical protein
MFKGNISEINRCLTFNAQAIDKCCPKKNQGVTVNTASPLTKPMSMKKTKYRSGFDPEEHLRLQLSSNILDLKLMCSIKQPHPSH